MLGEGVPGFGFGVLGDDAEANEAAADDVKAFILEM